MRIAFVHIPCFASAVEVLYSPHLVGKPLIVGDADEAKRVLDCSLEAAQAGVQPGMTARQALGLCPEAIVVPPDPVRYSGVWESVLDVLSDISPEVEDEGLGRSYINVAGLRGIHGDEASIGQQILDAVKDASGLEAAVGIAGGKFTALASAVTTRTGNQQIIPAGAGEAAFLAPLGVDLLLVADEVRARLRLLGLDTIGDVARLTVPELQSQFGFEGQRLWQLANGIDEERLRPRPYQERIESEWAFESPVAGIEVMIAVAKQLFSRLQGPLRGRAARELWLQAELISGRTWAKQVSLREAISEEDRLVFILKSTLNNFPPPTAIKSLSLRLKGITGESGKQLVLGERGRLQRQLEEAIRQLKAHYGHSPIYRCVDVEPWSVLPEERQILVESDD